MSDKADAAKPDDSVPEAASSKSAAKPAASKPDAMPKEVGGREGPEPTRYGDWENKGIISDF